MWGFADDKIASLKTETLKMLGTREELKNKQTKKHSMPLHAGAGFWKSWSESGWTFERSKKLY